MPFFPLFFSLLVSVSEMRAFFARLGYLAVLANRQLDSVDELLGACGETDEKRQELVNVVGLSVVDCRAVSAAVKRNPVACIAADNLVYNLTRRMNDEDMTSDDKLPVFVDSFSKLGDAEIVAPAGVADSMCSYLSDDYVRFIW